MLGCFCRTQTLNACSASGRGTAPNQDSELPELLQAISDFVPASPCTFFWFPTPEGIGPNRSSQYICTLCQLSSL